MTVAGELPSPEARLRFTLGLDAIVSVGGSLFALIVYFAAFRSVWLLVLSGFAGLAAIAMTSARRHDRTVRQLREAEERAATELGDVNDPLNWDFEEFNEETVVDVLGTMTEFLPAGLVSQ